MSYERVDLAISKCVVALGDVCLGCDVAESGCDCIGGPVACHADYWYVLLSGVCVALRMERQRA